MTSAYHPGCTTLPEGAQKPRFYILSKTPNLDCSICNPFYNYYWICIGGEKTKHHFNYVNPQNLEILGTPSLINSDGCSNFPKSALTYPFTCYPIGNVLGSSMKISWANMQMLTHSTDICGVPTKCYHGSSTKTGKLWHQSPRDCNNTAVSVKAMLWNSTKRWKNGTL